MVEEVRLDDGVTVKVLFELDKDGDADIWTHELKLSEETCRVPEHVVLEVLVVTVDVSIASLEVTAIVELTEMEVVASAGEDEETVGVVVSSSVDVVEEPLSLLLLQEITVKLKNDISIMCKILFIFSFQY